MLAVFCYLRGTINLGLWHSRGTQIDLPRYSDADFFGYKVDKKSTSGHSLVFKVRYIAVESCCAQAILIKYLSCVIILVR